MAVGSSFAVYGLAKIKLFDNGKWAEIKFLCDDITKLVIGNFARAEGINGNGKGVRNADGIGK